MSNKSINNSKISNIELVNNDAEITHTTGNGTFTIDSEDGNIQLGHTGININIIGNITVEGNLYNVIDLTGPDGNAFALMGYAQQFARQLDLDGNKIINNMKSGDYENLVKVFDDAFGDYVILER